MKVVIDTNVLVSALLNRAGIPSQILRAVWDGTLELVLNAPLQAEIESVLEYRKIRERLVAQAVDARLFVELLPLFTTTVTLDDVTVPRPRDADDWFVLATSVAAGADWLITGDADLLSLSEQFPILTPGAFVKRFLS